MDMNKYWKSESEIKSEEEEAKKKQELLDQLPSQEELAGKMQAVTTAVQKLIRVDELTEKELEQIILIYDEWDKRIGTKMVEGELIRYKGQLYRTLADHTIEQNYNPEITNYRYVLATPSEVIPEWFPVAGYQDAMIRNKGYKMFYNGKIYVSKIDGNSQEPTKDEPYNRYWEEVPK